MPHLEACAPKSTTCCVCHSHDRSWQAAELSAGENGEDHESDKVGLYFRRRQALWHAFIRLWNAYKSVLRRICLYFSRRHKRASTRARKRSSAQDAAKFNGAELSRFTPANASNSANHLPVSRIEFAADRSCNYVRELALDNQLVASES